MFAKFGRRAERWHVLPAFLVTFGEAVLTLVFVRLLFRLAVQGVRRLTGRGGKGGGGRGGDAKDVSSLRTSATEPQGSGQQAA
jgi:hypothetical protein